MPNRILREGILTSERVNQLDPAGEVFYRRLMSVVDDFGRYYGKPLLLRAACYPLQLDRVTDNDISAWIKQGQQAGLLVLYRVDGKDYLEVSDFRQQIRSKASKFPDIPADAIQQICECAADAQQVKSFAHLDVSVSVSGDGAKTSAKKNKTALPANFTASDAVIAWAEGKGIQNLERHVEHFITTCQAKGYKYVDWDAALRNAVTNDWARIGNGGRKFEL